MTSQEVIQVVGMGGNVELDAESYSVDELKQIIGMSGTESSIRILNASSLGVDSVKVLAGQGPNNVTFDLT